MHVKDSALGRASCMAAEAVKVREEAQAITAAVSGCSVPPAGSGGGMRCLLVRLSTPGKSRFRSAPLL